MKKFIFHIFALILIASLFSACSQISQELTSSDFSPQYGQVQFTISNLKASNAQISALITNVSKVIVSITDSSNKAIKTKLKLDLLTINNEYITSPFTLEAGSYKITEFYLVDSKDSVLYLTPQTGSNKASLVSHPLPLSFSLTANNTTVLNPELLSSTYSTASDFGYISFKFNITQTIKLLICALDTHPNLVSANIKIFNANNQSLYSGNINPAINVIEIKEQSTSYVVIANKDNQTVTKNLTLSEIQSYTSTPLTIYFGSEYSILEYHIDNFEDGNLTASPNWWTFDNTSIQVVSNTTSEYPGLGNYSIQITGSNPNYYIGGFGTIFSPRAEYTSLKLLVKGNGTGSLNIELIDDEDGDGNLTNDSDDGKFTYALNVNWTGWQIVNIPFSSFTNANPGVGDGKFSTTKTCKLQITGSSKDPADIKIDYLSLIK